MVMETGLELKRMCDDAFKNKYEDTLLEAKIQTNGRITAGIFDVFVLEFMKVFKMGVQL